MQDDLNAEGWPRKPNWSNPLGLPAPLSWKQLFYVCAIQGFGAACIDAGANFAIAYAMYNGADEVYMWPLPKNTLAGDMAVTVFIQGILTFVIASAMVHVDMRKKSIAAFPYPWPDTTFGAVVLRRGPEHATTKHGKLWRTFHQRHGLGRGLHFFSGSDVNDLFDLSLSAHVFFRRLFWSVWKGSVLSALYFLWIWPVAIAITAPIWGGSNMAHTWTPQLIKLVFAFVLGLTQTPIVACIALGSEDSVRVHRREMQDQRLECRFAGFSSTEKEPRDSLRSSVLFNPALLSSKERVDPRPPNVAVKFIEPVRKVLSRGRERAFSTVTR